MGPNRQRKPRELARGRGRGGRCGRGRAAAPAPTAPSSILSRAEKDMVIDVLHHAASGGAVPVSEEHFNPNSGSRIKFQRNSPLTPSEILQRLYEGLGFPPDLVTQYVRDLADESKLPVFNSIGELLAEGGPFQSFLVDSCFELFSYMLWYSREEEGTSLTPEEGDSILQEELEAVRALFDDSFIGLKNFGDDDTDDRELQFSFFTQDDKGVMLSIRIPDHYPSDPPNIFIGPRKQQTGGMSTLAVLPLDTKELPAVARRSILDAAVEAINGFVGEGCLIGLLSSICGAISSVSGLGVVEQLPTPAPCESKEVKAVIAAKRQAFASALSASEDPLALPPEEPSSTTCSLPAKVELGTVDHSDDEVGQVRREFLRNNKQLDAKLKEEWQALRANGTLRNSREQLPAYNAREELRQAVARHRVVVVSGETGSGKTTQIPQYLYEFMCEDGKGSSANIVCTQPRRLAATSVALRVAGERDEAVGGVVGYTIRLENCVSSRTQITYCTTGVVLRRIQVDKFLGRVSHIVVDEIHERGVDTDVLLILLRDLLERRDDLTVVLMSATMDSELFARYFGGSPIINIAGRTFPVQVFHLEEIIPMVNYSLDDGSPYAKWEVRKEERRRNTRKQMLDIDINEIEEARELTAGVHGPSTQLSASHRTLDILSRMNPDVINYELIESIVVYIDTKMGVPGAILIFLPGMVEMTSCMEQLKSNPKLLSSCLIYNLHSSLGSAEQQGVFQHPPKGKRKVVIGTNIMETSITIDDAVFVIDCGKVKENRYDARRSLSQLVTVNTSKANCRQRQGRAGRVREGFCFRLFTSTQFESLDDHQLCEMHRVPLESLVLQIYSLNLGDEVEYLRKALSPPDERAVRSSVKALTALGALTMDKRLTSLGRHLANLPLDVRIGKMVIHGAILQCVDPVLTIAACLAVRTPFLSAMDYQVEVEGVRRALSGDYMSDHLSSWFAYSKWIAMWHKEGPAGASKLCAKYYLSLPALRQIQATKQQYERFLYEAGLIEETPVRMKNNRFLYDPVVTLEDSVYESGGPRFNTNSGSVKCILSCIVAGLYPNVACVKTVRGGKGGNRTNITTLDGSEVLVHPSSVAGKEKAFASPLLVYVDKVKTSATFLREVSMVTPLHVVFFGSGRLEYLPKYGELVVDEATAFRCQSEDAVLLRHLKDQLDSALSQKINDPSKSWESTSSVVVRAILRLLKGDSSTVRGLTVVDRRQPRAPLTAPLLQVESSDDAPKKKDGSADKRTCFVCGEGGHVVNTCPHKAAAAKGGPVTRCFICGEWHHPTDCAVTTPMR
ncbi:RNA helicase, putative [Trypanosoma equiperdum]|uniref:RNA helicase n=1 Tax=Trypanosoma equiperdum TaxID=5694 RepID=A0A1G4I7J6_TRYEQ|nr:RNA helicase, putative [Trypanosoma equiperdum]